MKLRTVRHPLALTCLLLSACGADPDSALDSSEAAQELIPNEFFSAVFATVKTSLSSAEGNLSAGARDWAHFTDLNQINGGSFAGIKNFARIGTGPFARIATGPLAFSWTGGSPVASASDVRAHLRTCGAGSGFSFQFPGTTRGRKLRVFVGAHNAGVGFAAIRNGFIRPGATRIENPNGARFGYYDLTYSDTVDRDVKLELRVEQVGQTPLTNNSCISLLAAQMIDLPNTNGTVSLTGVPAVALAERSHGIHVNASHPDGVRGVELFYDNVKVGEDTTAPYEFNAVIKPGLRKFHAEVTTKLSTTFKSPATWVTGWYRIYHNGVQAIPDAGDWLEKPLSFTTSPIPSGRVVKNIIVETIITHPYVGDLQFRLVSPNDKSVLLSQYFGGSGNDYAFTEFRDDADTPIFSGAPPFTGEYAPMEPLSTMIGEPAVGARPWRFIVRDDFASDIGTVDAVFAWMLLD